MMTIDDVAAALDGREYGDEVPTAPGAYWLLMHWPACVTDGELVPGRTAWCLAQVFDSGELNAWDDAGTMDPDTWGNEVRVLRWFALPGPEATT